MIFVMLLVVLVVAMTMMMIIINMMSMFIVMLLKVVFAVIMMNTKMIAMMMMLMLMMHLALSKNGTEIHTKSFVSRYFRKSLNDLMQKMSNANAWFVRCVRPNADKRAGRFSTDLVMNQLRYTGVLQIAQIRRDGFAIRLPFSDFVTRYKEIAFPAEESVPSNRHSVQTILEKAELSGYVFGKSKIFLRHWQGPVLQTRLERRRREIAEEKEKQRKERERRERQRLEHERLQREELKKEQERRKLTSSARDDQRERNGGEQSGVADGETKHVSMADNISEGSSAAHKVREWMKMNEKVEANGSSPGEGIQRQANGFTANFPDKNEGSVLDAQDEQSNAPKTEIPDSAALDQNLWDRFQIIPRDNVDTSKNLRTFLKFFKCFFYLILILLVLGSAVANKLSILVMTSGIVRDLKTDDPNPTNTMILIGLCLPYVLWFLNYSARSLFGSSHWPTFKMIICMLLIEMLHSAGACLILFRVLPHTDMLRALLIMSCMYVVPSVCKTGSAFSDKSVSNKKKLISGTINSVAFLIQVSSIIVCSLFGTIYSDADRVDLVAETMTTSGQDAVYRKAPSSSSNASWELPVGLLLISIVSWENYISRDVQIGRFKFPFNMWKKNLHLVRQQLYIFVSLWKIGCSVLLAVVLCENFKFTMSFTGADHIVLLSQNSSTGGDTATTMHFLQYGPLYANILSSLLCSYVSGLACKLCMQRVGFSLPLALATPVSAAFVMMQCKYNFLSLDGTCYFWVCPEKDQSELIFYLVMLGLVWFSQMVVVSHIWFPGSSRMAKIERLFITPMRCSMFTDQNLMLRRRRDDRDQALLKFWEEDMSLNDDGGDFVRPETVIPQIYACATMWHETTEEMTQLFKSIFRIDIDHSARFLAQKYYGIKDPDYYEFEAHIFFDDAMELSDDDKLVPNSFVSDFVECLDNALSAVHERQIVLGPPTRTPTPYGGQLTWTLPGGTCLVAHLKDKHKIRHKKRWSQVMYMYYLLGFRILAQPESLRKKGESNSTGNQFMDCIRLTTSQLRRRRRAAHFSRSVLFNYVSEEVQTQAENTYLLALDGDVDFKPEAVRLLVDRMKKNKKCGAACGRIHPTGSGPILWYQLFEYAIGHWLLKATEHVFGCVLCAPGCFSLFRGSALMDDNVARMYSTRATEAGQYVQYDQGEDRWLSTLLLQQGHRIDYCAAADAMTHAPETFSEFFNQRRRWGPSTLANIINLLGDWRNTVRLNDNLSSPYMFYQFALLVSTLLGPATVLLMMAGAYTVVFKTSIVQSYTMALGPPICYILICMYLKPEVQLTIGAVLSALYAVVMTIVLVGTVGTAIEGSITSPNVIFIILLVFVFLIAAFMHPEEFGCVIPGALYFVCIPAGYLILNIYFLCNLHVVSWGTREVPKRKTKEDVVKEKEAEEEKRKKSLQKKGFLGWLGIQSFMNEIGEVFKQLKMMMYDASHVERQKGKSEELLEQLIIEIRKDRGEDCETTFTARTRSESAVSKQSKTASQAPPLTTVTVETPKLHDEIPSCLLNEDPDNPAWMTSPITGNGPVVLLDERELAFWNQLIRKYLKPIVLDKEHQMKMTSDLLSLRNNVVFGFFMTSSLWIALSMELEALQGEFQDFLFFHIPRFGSEGNPLTFQPLGLFFLSFFATLLFFQFVGMFAHRWGTMLHMLSITELVFGQQFTEQDKIRDIILKVIELQKLRDIENEPDPDSEEPLPDYISESDAESSHYSESISSQEVPPSYHTHDVTGPGHTMRRLTSRRRKEIFDRLGHPTGHTLAKVFEKRFRNRLEIDRHEHMPGDVIVETVDEDGRRSPAPDYMNY
ncbi:chitin synthase chs-2-like [Gigantopelta aegis]|uniref:chitin synthase chs-2-like n=1 Tax=Gigantopelta aegis TaxID=1735272 RepID=UPI001B88D717|nr:chitin synthase chs-2-like [Gigantopelta aegis]